MALKEIYLEIFGFHGSPSQKVSWPLLYSIPNLLTLTWYHTAWAKHIAGDPELNNHALVGHKQP